MPDRAKVEVAVQVVDLYNVAPGRSSTTIGNSLAGSDAP